MKTQLIDKNGLLKPIGMFFILLGMFLLILLLYVCCSPENLFAQSGNFKDHHYTYNYSVPEATIVYVRYKIPGRIISTIEPKVDINKLSTQLIIRKTSAFENRVAHAEREEVKTEKKNKKQKREKTLKLDPMKAVRNDKDDEYQD